MSKFKDIVEDVPVIMEYRKVRGKNVTNMNFACCDCGLIHNIALVPLRTRLRAYFWRDNRRTANHRRAKK